MISSPLEGETDDANFCAVNLINEELVVDGTSVSLFFRDTNAVEYQLYRLRGVNTDTGLSHCEQLIV